MAEEDVQVEAAGGETAFGSSEFESLLQKEFRPKSDQAKTAVESAVKALAEQALSNTALISDDALRSIEGIVAEIEQKADRTGEPDPAPRRVPADGKRVARHALSGQQY